MIITTFKKDDAILVSRFAETSKRGEYIMEFNAITLDGKLTEIVTENVSEGYVCTRLNSCRSMGGTMIVVKDGVVTYSCNY